LYFETAILPILLLQYNTVIFFESGWLSLIAYGLFYGLLILDSFHDRQDFPVRLFGPVNTVSVVVPVLNEVQNIPTCLEILQRERDVVEIIAVDGGSTDGTQEKAGSMGVQVIQTKRGRGYQIKVGVEHCRGDVILVVHADCRIQEGIPSLILRELSEKPHCLGGSLGMEYLRNSMKQRLIATVNNVRARWAGISFGDQGQFFRREALPLILGFPELVLMEDVELSMRLKQHGSQCFIPKGIAVSTRRWEKAGFWINVKQVLSNCLIYLIQRRLGLKGANSRDFYERYYLSGHP
jgi:rSAM/selenodomain-associated transferase 2